MRRQDVKKMSRGRRWRRREEKKRRRDDDVTTMKTVHPQHLQFLGTLGGEYRPDGEERGEEEPCNTGCLADQVVGEEGVKEVHDG